jgi:hypothetical protein
MLPLKPLLSKLTAFFSVSDLTHFVDLSSIGDRLTAQREKTAFAKEKVYVETRKTIESVKLNFFAKKATRKLK